MDNFGFPIFASNSPSAVSAQARRTCTVRGLDNNLHDDDDDDGDDDDDDDDDGVGDDGDDDEVWIVCRQRFAMQLMTGNPLFNFHTRLKCIRSPTTIISSSPSNTFACQTTPRIKYGKRGEHFIFRAKGCPAS